MNRKKFINELKQNNYLELDVTYKNPYTKEIKNENYKFIVLKDRVEAIEDGQLFISLKKIDYMDLDSLLYHLFFIYNRLFVPRVKLKMKQNVNKKWAFQ